MRRSVVAVVVGAAVLGGAAPSGAQSPSYGGGLLPAASPPRGYHPTMGIVLQPRGAAIALRFDTSILCGRQSYQPAGRATVPFDGRTFLASKRGRRISLVGGRITYSWKVSGVVDGTIASGKLRITGVRRLHGRRVPCRRKPDRAFSARVAAPAPGGSPTPPPRAAFGGLSDVRLGGLRAPVVLKVSRDARKMASRWTARAACGDGKPLDLVNYTPPMDIRADGSFSRSGRFTVRFADSLIRYRVRFAGRVSGEMANGTLRARARITTRDGRRLITRCDTSLQHWSAAMLPPPASAPPAQTGPQWSLRMTSEPGEYVGGTGEYSFPASPGDRLVVEATPSVVQFHLDPARTPVADWWDITFSAGSSHVLAPGTYRSTRYPFNDDAPGFAASSSGRGCNELDATFTIREIAFGADGKLETFQADFVQHCEHDPPALRGTWSYRVR